jgi:hypothetical protein
MLREKIMQSVEENQEGKGRKHLIKTKQKMDNIEHGSSGLRPFKGDDKKYKKYLDLEFYGCFHVNIFIHNKINNNNQQQQKPQKYNLR